MISISSNKDGAVERYYLTVDGYRFVNDKADGDLTILRPKVHAPGTSGPSYEEVYVGHAVDFDPCDIERHRTHLKTILVFM